MNRIFILLITIVFSTPVKAGFEILDSKQGLSNSVVTSIVKDVRGLMWVGTLNGLNTYDGYTFKRPYREFTDMQVTALVYDTALHRIWVGTQAGLYSVSIDNGLIRRIAIPSGWASSKVVSLQQLPGGDVAAAYQNGLIEFVDSSLKTRRTFAPHDPGNGKPVVVYDMVVGNDSSLIIVAQNNRKLFCLDPATRKLSAITSDGKLQKIIFVQRYGIDILVGTADHGILLISGTDYQDITPSDIVSLNRLNQHLGGGMLGAAWRDAFYLVYGFHSAHYLYHPAGGNIDKIYEQDINNGNGWKQNNCFFTDEYGIIWIGTDRGVVKIIREEKHFGHLLYNEAPPVSARGMIQDESGDLYIGSYWGLYHFSQQEGKWRQYPLVKTDQLAERPASPFDLLNDTGGYVYIASTFMPFYRFNKKEKKFETNFYHRKNIADIPRAYSLFRDRSRKVWIGTHNGLLTFNEKDSTLRQHQNDAFNVGSSIVRYISQAREENMIWVATDNGLFQVHTEKGVIARWHTETTPALSGNDIFFVRESVDGRVWIGTNGAGINILSPDRKQVAYLNKNKDGLCHDIVYGMLWQDDGRIWISTFNGLSRYDPAIRHFDNFYSRDGLTTNEFNQNSFLKDADGKMYFGTVNGINIFSLDRMSGYKVPPPKIFVIPTLKWDNGNKAFNRLYNPSGQDEKIELFSPNSQLIFNLGITDYTDPGNNVFSYRIKGLTDQWTVIQGPPVLLLNGIPYGHYFIEIKAVAASGYKTTNILRFHVHVKQPFYKTWWFYLVLLVIVAGIIYFIFYIKYTNLKLLQQLRIQIASDLHDEVGGLLTRITLFSESVRFEDGSLHDKNEQLDRIMELSRSATTSMSDILWAIDARNDNRDSLVDRMREYAEHMLLSSGVTIHFNGGDPAQKQLQIPTRVRQQIYSVFKEAINNILKHAEASFVSITWRYNGTQVFLRIKNDGVRNTASSGRSGQGLRNMEMRAGDIGARICFDRNSDVFTVTLEN